MKTWKRWIVKWLGIKQEIFKGNLDTERALRDKNKEILELKHEVERLRGFTVVWTDPTVRTRGYPQTAAYEPPEKHTDPSQFGMRHRATMRQWTEDHTLMHHHNEMLKKKAQTVKLDPETVQLPNVNPLRKLTMQRYDGPPLPDTTMASIPTWIL